MKPASERALACQFRRRKLVERILRTTHTLASRLSTLSARFSFPLELDFVRVLPSLFLYNSKGNQKLAVRTRGVLKMRMSEIRTLVEDIAL